MRERRNLLDGLHQPWVTYVLLGMVTASLALHLLTWIGITQLRNVARGQVHDLAEQIALAEHEVIAVNIKLNQPVPIRADVPVQKQLTVPISTTVALDETIQIPLDTPFGSFQVPVPIRADIPVNTTVPIAFDETVSISTTVDLNLDVPISIAIADTSLATYLRNLHQKLIELGERL